LKEVQASVYTNNIIVRIITNSLIFDIVGDYLFALDRWKQFFGREIEVIEFQFAIDMPPGSDLNESSDGRFLKFFLLLLCKRNENYI